MVQCEVPITCAHACIWDKQDIDTDEHVSEETMPMFLHSHFYFPDTRAKCEPLPRLCMNELLH
jgi:hypothetical protein